MRAALVTQPLAPAKRSAQAVPPGAVCPSAASHAQRVPRVTLRSRAAAATEVAETAQASEPLHTLLVWMHRDDNLA